MLLELTKIKSDHFRCDPFNLIILGLTTLFKACTESCIKLGPSPSLSPLVSIGNSFLWPVYTCSSSVYNCFFLHLCPNAYLLLHQKHKPLALCLSNFFLVKDQLFLCGIWFCNLGIFGVGNNPVWGDDFIMAIVVIGY